MFATFALLTLAIVSLWFGGASNAPVWRRFAWVLPFAGAATAAFAANILTPVGLLWTALFAAATAAYARKPALAPRWRILIALGIVALSAGLMAHLLPGFNNPRVLSDLRLTIDALPYRLHLNFDKPLIGLFIVAFLLPSIRIAKTAEWRAMLGRMIPVMLATIGLLMALSLVAGYVRFAPKFPPSAWLWLWANLCLTCFAEEAFFRGFVQRELAHLWQTRRNGAWLALGVAALLFGLAHAGGGPVYVALSTIAGIGYGWAMQRTGRLEASILTHFAVNATHFLFFTYPALAVR